MDCNLDPSRKICTNKLRHPTDARRSLVAMVAELDGDCRCWICVYDPLSCSIGGDNRKNNPAIVAALPLGQRQQLQTNLARWSSEAAVATTTTAYEERVTNLAENRNQ
jgi:hypothetical protein